MFQSSVKTNDYVNINFPAQSLPVTAREHVLLRKYRWHESAVGEQKACPADTGQFSLLKNSILQYTIAMLSHRMAYFFAVSDCPPDYDVFFAAMTRWRERYERKTDIWRVMTL